MSATFRVDSESAIASAWSEALAVALAENRPHFLELVGPWPDLSVFAGSADSVRSLRLSGTVSNGRVPALAGLACFTNLETLSLAGQVDAGLGPLAGSPITRLEAPAQAGLMAHLARSSVLHLDLLGAEPASFDAPEGLPPIRALRLVRPKLDDLQPLAGFSGLASLGISYAPKLRALRGIERLPLEDLSIETASALADLQALSSASRLRSLRLVGLAKGIALPSLAGFVRLRTVHLGGRDFGPIDWLALLDLPALQKIFAPWDPARLERPVMEASLAPDRRIVRFEPTGGRGVRMLFLEIAPADPRA